MRKAFLCHSSTDKEYVRTIARWLGRAQVVLDEISFSPGQDFRDEIRRRLSESALFVFLVSRAALESVWCKFELNEAEFLRLQGRLVTQLAIIIDRNVRFADLPGWLQRTKVLVQPRPSQAARDVQQSLLSIIPVDGVRPFVGRQDIQQRFAEALATPGTAQRKVLLVSGLDGIGRRSYLERACLDSLGLSLGPFFVLDETRDLEDIYLWLLDETSELGSRDKIAAEIAAFSRLDQSQKLREIVNLLRVLCAHCLPCLIDQGGCLDDSGHFTVSHHMLN